MSAGPRGQRAPERTHDAGGNAPRQAEGIADGDHQLADAKRRGIAEPSRLEIAVLGHEHREVRERIAPPDAEAELASVGKIEPAAVTAGDHVR